MELYATELMGSKAYDLQGNYVGRVREFFIEPAQTNPIAFPISRGHFHPLLASRPDRYRCGWRDSPQCQRTRVAAL